MLLTYAVRVQDVKRGEKSWCLPRVAVAWSDGANAQRVTYDVEHPVDWQEQTVEVAVPEGQAACRVQFGMIQCGGVMDVASLSFKVR